MSVFIRLFFVGLMTLISVTVHAREMQLDASVLLTTMDAGGNDNFKSGKGLTLQYSYYLKQWLAADIGLFVSDQTFTDTSQDVVGDYRASIQSKSILLGIKPRHRFTAPYEVYARLGIQYWQTELEVEEYFNESVPGGKTSATDTGTGYYASLGGAHYISERVVVQLELRHMMQLDVFEGESGSPFDLRINALSFGFGYRF
jgi:opacity protein-like surface antigen